MISPIWDPSVCGDGRYIVYSAYREQKVGIWRMDADGSNPIRIADETFAISPTMFSGWQVGDLFTGSFLDSDACDHHGREASGDDCTEPGGLDWRCSRVLARRKADRISRRARVSVENPSSPSASQPNQLKVIAFDGGALLHQFDWPARQPVSPAGRQRVTPLTMC